MLGWPIGMDRRLACLYVLLVAVAAFALFANLDDRFLWGDESHSAYLAQNIVRFGLPLASDGVNDLAQYGRDTWTSRSGAWIWTPWLAEYLAAGSFLLFGETTFAARLPFAVIAFLSVLLFARLVYRVYGSHELALSATLLYVTCVPLLLHSRQCRYYALVLFAQVWLLFGFHRVVRRDRMRGALHLGAALTVQFYSNYLVVPANMLALIVAALLLRRRLPGVVPGVGLGVALALAAAVPWLLYANPLGQAGVMGAASPLRIGGFFLRAVHFHIVPLAIFLLAPLAIRRGWARRKAGSDPAERAVDLLLLLIVSASLVLLSITASFFRYLIPLIPVLLLLAARVVDGSLRPWLLRVAVIALLAFTNLFSVATGWWAADVPRLASPLLRYVRSITTPYTNRSESVIRFLWDRARPGESLYSASVEAPIMFYTDLRVIDARAHRQLDPDDLPDWIFPKPTGVKAVAIRQREGQLTRLVERSYERIELDVPATPIQGVRPDPKLHEFFTAPEYEAFVIFRRKRQGREESRATRSVP